MSENIHKLSHEFYAKFNQNHVLLYVGQDIDSEALKKWIAPCRWSAVITSRQESEFSAHFNMEARSPQEVTIPEAVPTNPLSRANLPIWRLWGMEGEENNDDIPWDEEFQHMYCVRDFLRFLPGLLKPINSLVMIGINSKRDWKIIEELAMVLHRVHMPAETVSVWGMPKREDVEAESQKAYNILIRVCQGQSFPLYETHLSDVCKSLADLETQNDEDEMEDGFISSTDVYFHGKKPIYIKSEELSIFRGKTLLTEETVRGVHPSGRVQTQRYFFKFLEDSPVVGAQWYGYLPPSSFYVKRSYEDVLEQLVRKLLSGEGPARGMDTAAPVVLSGDPSSSKSITLGALAYHIYNEKNNPVVYVFNDSFLSYNLGGKVEELDEFLYFLEERSISDARILVILDCSSYRAGVEQAIRITKLLQNRGRRFVLVCSGYRMFVKEGAKVEPDSQNVKGAKKNAYFGLNRGTENQFERCSEEDDWQVALSDGVYYVRTSREMNETERKEFWRQMEKYSGLSDSVINRLKDELNEKSDIFDFYYQIVSILRENLEGRFKTERATVLEYVRRELPNMVKDVNARALEDFKERNAGLYKAFRELGFDFDGYERKCQAETDELMKRLEHFNICVALFSRFKLEVPCTLAYSILMRGSSKIENQVVDGSRDNSIFSRNDQALFREVTKEIPWIYYGESESGNESYVFRFRNQREAEIFLRKHESNGEKQILILEEILDIYQEDYRENRYIDIDFTRNLQDLLRSIGPNTNYLPFRDGGECAWEHKEILKNLNRLIGKLDKMLNRTALQEGIPDDDAGFASIVITFTREYYGGQWDKLYRQNRQLQPWEDNPDSFSPERYEERIKGIRSAVVLADRSARQIEGLMNSANLNKFERNRLSGQKDSLNVEMAQCVIRLKPLIGEYRELCNSRGTSPDPDTIRESVMPYQALYRSLRNIIDRRQTNGYAYNALFRLFEQEYQTLPESANMKKLQYLSEIMQVVETCRILGENIEGRGSNGRDELSRHIVEISDYSASFKITLDSIQRHLDGNSPQNEDEEAFFSLYDDMLNANNPAAITFVCQKELSILDYDCPLNAEQIARCDKVRRFIVENERNLDCVSRDAYAVALLMRVCWMLYNGTVLNPSLERQTTRLNLEHWEELRRYGEWYDRLTQNADVMKQPVIMALYALATFQANGTRNPQSYSNAKNILNSIREEDFGFMSRMRTLFTVCKENGEPYLYTGTVLSIDEKNNGWMSVDGLIPYSKEGVRFRKYYLGRSARNVKVNAVLGDLELGVGYTSFSVYKESGQGRCRNV